MSPFTRHISHIFRLPSRFRRTRRQPTLPANIAVANWQCKLVQPAVEFPLHTPCKSILELPTDSDAIEVKENEGTQDDDEGDAKDEDDAKSAGVDDSDAEDVDEDTDPDVEGEDTPETFPFDLVLKTRLEMMLHRLYVALSDDDREIAALRTRDNQMFTHIVRITFDSPPVENKIRPSYWSGKTAFSGNAPFELSIKCPSFALAFGEHCTALTKKQLLLARLYISVSLPYRNDMWEEQDFKLPFSPEQCANAKLLIVGPTDRSVDVMAILFSYIASLAGASNSKLLASVRKLDFVHSHWKNCTVGNMAVGVENGAL